MHNLLGQQKGRSIKDIETSQHKQADPCVSLKKALTDGYLQEEKSN